MPKFIIKPVELEAIQYQWDDETISQEEAEDNIADFINQNIQSLSDHEMILIEISGEKVDVERGDWVIKIEGEFEVLSDEALKNNFAPYDTWLDRVRFEQSIVGSNTEKLTVAISKERPSFVSEVQWAYMGRQSFHQTQYNNILLDRIASAELDLANKDA
ncbi:hypothetical protein [Acinetobacter sp. CFCC 10889]|uniref:crAss001_48 related protein n=1 Tax=Acinetobacter sp. CFCC 10889 TaxID=1775557 RepID=UPI000DD02FB7|nr:hypothetical protein [Acinetobacter sp. CFCC 10889]